MSNIVIIPTYKEKENIELLSKPFLLCLFHSIFWLLMIIPLMELLLSLKTLQLIFPNLHLIERPGKLGLGTAYITGFKWALENDYSLYF